MDKTSETQAPKRGVPPMHPGALLREDILPALKAAGIAKRDVAEKLGVGRQTLENLLLERSSVSPEMALRLGKLCGNGPDLWMNLQKTWDLALAEARLQPELAKIPTLRVA